MKQTTNKDLLYCTGNYTEYFVITCKRKELEEECVCVCVTDSVCHTPKNNTTLYVNYTSVFKK